MLYSRGNKQDFDYWEKLGNAGWSFRDVLPYFKKSEDNQNERLAQNRKHIGAVHILRSTKTGSLINKWMVSSTNF